MPAGMEPKEKKPLKRDPTQAVIDSFKKVAPKNRSGHIPGRSTGHRS